MTAYHIPVLLNQVVDQLRLRPGMIVLDGTIGGGGHARSILERIVPGGQLIGFDQDVVAIHQIQSTLGKQYTPAQLFLIHDNVRRVRQYVHRLDAAVLDLGVSAHQLATPGRGFSFQHPADPLDMRMDQRHPITAADLLRDLSISAIGQLLRNYGEEPRAQVIARAIGQQRQLAPIRTVADLLTCVAAAYGSSDRRIKGKHVATRTWQALRIAVNEELILLPELLRDCIDLLTSGGRLAVIAFHSLEDRIVKQQFVQASKNCLCPPELPECRCDHRASIRLITTKPIQPTSAEVATNPKARSAKLRVIEKL
ncbi:MAG: 16S rRNA (cytosine(1402)-N(4))-methyltransferase RsmH [Candidatus Kerfeldbacteria bacterium]|nr:16S rRNA (cytosine(1402)-N(4))-methyltransferase RsmH [Candidatus Kerfeldbacteria bacterium]